MTFLRRFSPTRVFAALFATFLASFRGRAVLQIEILALRHQLGVLHRSGKRPRLTAADRLLWAWLCQVWIAWRPTPVIVWPETVIARPRKGFRLFWTRKIQRGEPVRPPVSKETRNLIRKMSRENPRWGAPRIHGEFLKLGIDVGVESVREYMMRRRKPRGASLARTLTLPLLWWGDCVKQWLQPPAVCGDRIPGVRSQNPIHSQNQ